jgi:hypothetical protein
VGTNRSAGGVYVWLAVCPTALSRATGRGSNNQYCGPGGITWPVSHAVYGTADSTARSLEETFGGRLGYTNPESHSGYNAVRYHLSAYIDGERKKPYSELIGPLVTHTDAW